MTGPVAFGLRQRLPKVFVIPQRLGRSLHHGPASVAAAETSPGSTPQIGPGATSAEAHFEVPHRFVLGLHSISDKEWLVRDHNLKQDLASKAELLGLHATRQQVLGALKGSQVAQEELLAEVSENLMRFHSCAVVDADFAGPAAAIEKAGHAVQEDLLLVEKVGDAWVFTAGCVCFPSRWSFLSKIGRPMREIHAPVPGLNEKLGLPIERFFDKLKPGRIVLRMNSTIMDSPVLFQPGVGAKKLGTDANGSQTKAGVSHSETIDVSNAGDRLLLRMERQTLRRLPVSGAIAFTIHTFQMRLPDVAANYRLAKVVEAHYRSLLGTGMDGYKSYIRPFCDYLSESRQQQSHSQSA